jgi:hypothetical protein
VINRLPLAQMLTSARGLLVDASQVQAHSTASCGRCYTRSLMRLTHELRLSLAAQNVTAHSVRLARSAFLHKTEHKHGCCDLLRPATHLRVVMHRKGMGELGDSL